MNKNFRKIESEDEMLQLLKKYELFREDDVTFEDLAAENMYVYAGDDFAAEAEMLSELGLSALLVEGSVHVDYLSVGDILPDYGVFCVTGDVRCKDFYYATESTGMVVGGNLLVENALYADCGNSVLQVNKNFDAKLLFDSQCSIDVRGRERTEFDKSATPAQLQALGIDTTDGQTPAEAVRAYFQKYKS